MSTFYQKLQYLSNTKAAIKAALVQKGVAVSDEDTFRSYASKILSVTNGGESGVTTITFYLRDKYGNDIVDTSKFDIYFVGRNITGNTKRVARPLENYEDLDINVVDKETSNFLSLVNGGNIRLEPDSPQNISHIITLDWESSSSGGETPDTPSEDKIDILRFTGADDGLKIEVKNYDTGDTLTTIYPENGVATLSLSESELSNNLYIKLNGYQNYGVDYVTKLIEGNLDFYRFETIKLSRFGGIDTGVRVVGPTEVKLNGMSVANFENIEIVNDNAYIKLSQIDGELRLPNFSNFSDDIFAFAPSAVWMWNSQIDWWNSEPGFGTNEFVGPLDSNAKYKVYDYDANNDYYGHNINQNDNDNDNPTGEWLSLYNSGEGNIKNDPNAINVFQCVTKDGSDYTIKLDYTTDGNVYEMTCESGKWYKFNTTDYPHILDNLHDAWLNGGRNITRAYLQNLDLSNTTDMGGLFAYSSDLQFCSLPLNVLDRNNCNWNDFLGGRPTVYVPATLEQRCIDGGHTYHIVSSKDDYPDECWESHYVERWANEKTVTVNLVDRNGVDIGFGYPIQLYVQRDGTLYNYNYSNQINIPRQTWDYEMMLMCYNERTNEYMNLNVNDTETAAYTLVLTNDSPDNMTVTLRLYSYEYVEYVQRNFKVTFNAVDSDNQPVDNNSLEINNVRIARMEGSLWHTSSFGYQHDFDLMFEANSSEDYELRYRLYINGNFDDEEHTTTIQPGTSTVDVIIPQQYILTTLNNVQLFKFEGSEGNCLVCGDIDNDRCDLDDERINAYAIIDSTGEAILTAPTAVDMGDYIYIPHNIVIRGDYNGDNRLSENGNNYNCTGLTVLTSKPIKANMFTSNFNNSVVTSGCTDKFIVDDLILRGDGGMQDWSGVKVKNHFKMENCGCDIIKLPVLLQGCTWGWSLCSSPQAVYGTMKDYERFRGNFGHEDSIGSTDDETFWRLSDYVAPAKIKMTGTGTLYYTIDDSEEIQTLVANNNTVEVSHGNSTVYLKKFIGTRLEDMQTGKNVQLHDSLKGNEEYDQFNGYGRYAKFFAEATDIEYAYIGWFKRNGEDGFETGQILGLFENNTSLRILDLGRNWSTEYQYKDRFLAGCTNLQTIRCGQFVMSDCNEQNPFGDNPTVGEIGSGCNFEIYSIDIWI